MKRYNLEETGQPYESDRQMVEDPDGEYIKWEDIKEIDQILLDLWLQFSDKGTKNGIPHQYSYGLSALESLESYLQENDLIDGHGIPQIRGRINNDC